MTAYVWAISGYGLHNMIIVALGTCRVHIDNYDLVSYYNLQCFFNNVTGVVSLQFYFIDFVFFCWSLKSLTSKKTHTYIHAHTHTHTHNTKHTYIYTQSHTHMTSGLLYGHKLGGESPYRFCSKANFLNKNI